MLILFCGIDTPILWRHSARMCNDANNCDGSVVALVDVGSMLGGTVRIAKLHNMVKMSNWFELLVGLENIEKVGLGELFSLFRSLEVIWTAWTLLLNTFCSQALLFHLRLKILQKTSFVRNKAPLSKADNLSIKLHRF